MWREGKEARGSTLPPDLADPMGKAQGSRCPITPPPPRGLSAPREEDIAWGSSKGEEEEEAEENGGGKGEELQEMGGKKPGPRLPWEKRGKKMRLQNRKSRVRMFNTV